VVYLGLKSGEQTVRDLHRQFSGGVLEHECAWPFHPHVTIAQDFDAAYVHALAARARDIWAAWKGSRTFTVERLSFVQHVIVGHWADLATVNLAAGQPVA
jgi:hypothetical protein